MWTLKNKLGLAIIIGFFVLVFGIIAYSFQSVWVSLAVLGTAILATYLIKTGVWWLTE